MIEREQLKVVADANVYMGLKRDSDCVSDACRKNKSYGQLSDGTKLHWKYIEN